MQALADIAPLDGERGNWEAWWFKHVDTFADTGMTELTGTPIPLSVRNQKICLVGATVSDEQTLSSVIHSLPREIFTIALHHYPASVNVLDGTVDLLLTGDTHGGQISILFLGPLVRIKRWDRLFHADGLRITPKGTSLYVNRGVGMEGGRVPRVRFNVPPEVTLIEAGPSK
jgi:predicted MPP superfamily phosphohydrolase